MLFVFFKKNKYYLYGLLFTVSLIFAQSVSDSIYFLLKQLNYKNNIADLEENKKQQKIIINELNKQNILLKVENESYNKYKELFNKLNLNRYKKITILNALYIQDKYMILKTSNQLNINDVVIDENDFLVGIVVKSTRDMAKIALLTNERINIPVKILGKNINGTITGASGFDINSCNIEMYDVDDVKNINDGDILLTSGKYGLIPFGLKIGKVYHKNGKLCVERVKNNSDLFFSINYLNDQLI